MELKFCNTCKEDKAIDLFNYKVKSKNIRCSNCTECTKKMGRSHYKNNTKYYKDRNALSIKNKRKELSDIKTSSGCRECGEDHPACLDFHHLGDKEFSIAYGVNIFGKEKLKKEVNKCIVLCKNCHAKVHYNIRNAA